LLSLLFLCYKPLFFLQLLFLPFLIHSLPVFASPSSPSPTCHITPPSDTLTIH
jgi:hypothetical protein